MARQQSNRPRRKPGHRPPHRPKAGPGPGRREPQGFTVPGMRQLFDLVLPMRGEERKQFYNQASAGLVAGLGLGGAIVGFSWGGVFGAIVGLGVAATAAGALVEKQRFYRR